MPVRLPEILVQLHDDDTATISGDTGVSEQKTSQSALGAVLADAADRAGTAIRVELHEADGTRYVDILTPPGPAGDRSRDIATTETSPARRRQSIDIARGGFLPGETILFAPAARAAMADHAGHVAVHLDHRLARLAVSGVLVFGTVSGSLLLVEPS